MAYEACKRRLKHYFGNITYIDDRFDQCLIDEPVYLPVEEMAGPPLPVHQGEIADKEESIEDEKTQIVSSETNLAAMLVKLNDDKYEEIHLHPILYTQSIEDSKLCDRIFTSPLTVMDWNLGNGRNAFSIIHELFLRTQCLRVVVVYTANYNEALDALKEDTEMKEYQEFMEEKEDCFSCYQGNNKSLLILAQKNMFNVLALIDKVSDIFLKYCGVMPVALLDYMESSQNNSDSLIGDFSYPFEAMYSLQMSFSEMAESDVPGVITSFIQNRLLSACVVCTDIVAELFQSKRDLLKRFADRNEADARGVFSASIDILKGKTEEDNQDIWDTMLKEGFLQFRSCCASAAQSNSHWPLQMDEFNDLIAVVKNAIIEERTKRLLSNCIENSKLEGQGETIEKLKQELMKIVEQQYKTKVEAYLKQTLPILIEMVISKDQMLFSVIGLIKNMKYTYYQEKSLRGILAGKERNNKQAKLEALMNIIHFGDILVKDNEYLLCMTPPCDAFRPSKTKGTYIFIRGAVTEKNALTNKRKECFHLSVAPATDGSDSIIFISWCFYAIEKFDLTNEKDLNRFREYERPYMMDESYARQISAKFTSFFSRAGVDELFVKAEENLRSIFA